MYSNAWLIVNKMWTSVIRAHFYQSKFTDWLHCITTRQTRRWLTTAVDRERERERERVYFSITLQHNIISWVKLNEGYQKRQKLIELATHCKVLNKLEIISTLLRRIGIPPPTAPPGESPCIKTGNQIGGWVFSRSDHVIRGGPKYTNFLASPW